MRRTAPLVTLAALAMTVGGCYGQVNRSLTIESEPEGAVCWLNDNEVGRTPLTVPFTWYGTYGVRLEAPGYEPLVAEAKVGAPVYEWLGLDLLFETVVPGTRHDRHVFRYALSEVRPDDPVAIRGRAEGLRKDARTPVP